MMCVTVTVGAAEKISLWFETCERVFVQYLRNIIDRSLVLWVPFLLVVRLVLLYFNIWERERERAGIKMLSAVDSNATSRFKMQSEDEHEAFAQRY
jgi:hypothetical protein